MPVTTPLPTPPNSVARPSTFNADTDAFLAALPQFQTELDAYAAGSSPIGRNMLINGAFQIHQRNQGSVADDAYCADRWYALTQTGAIASSIIADPEDGYTHALRLTQSQASAQRFGFAQIVEGVNCKFGRGGSVTLSGRLRCSVAATIRYAILAWGGTEDTVTSDVVNDWTNATFTPGNFFNASNLTVVASGSLALAANTITQITAINGAAGSTFNNLIAVIWTDTPRAQNVTLDAVYLQLETGAAASPFERRSYATEFDNCQRYYQQIGTAGETYAAGASFGATDWRGIIKLNEKMRTNPSFVAVGTFYISDQFTSHAASGLNYGGSGDTSFGGSIGATSVGLTTGQGSLLTGNSGYLTFDAEL